MVHVRFINDQETVVTVPVRPDVDRWVLAVMPVKIKLELLRDTLCVNGVIPQKAISILAITCHKKAKYVFLYEIPELAFRLKNRNTSLNGSSNWTVLNKEQD